MTAYHFFPSLTLISETSLLLFLTRKYFQIKSNIISTPRLLLIGFFTSFATLPYLWFVFPNLIPSYFLYTIISESFVVTIETIIYHLTLNLNLKKSFTLSLLCNLFSFLLGKIDL